MTESGIDKKVPETIPFVRERDLSQYEEVLAFGSSTHEGLNFALLDQQFADGKLDPTIMSPRGITFPVTPDEAHAIQNRREDQVELVGSSFAFLDPIAQLQVARKNLDFRLQPVGVVNHTNGAIDPVYRVSIVDRITKTEVNDPDLEQFFVLSDFHDKHLSFGPALKDAVHFMHPISLKEKHDV